MTTFFPINLKCPVCETQFTSQEVGSCGFASKRTDFRPNYWGFNPVFYFYHFCSHCGFCSTKTHFEIVIENAEFKKRVKKMSPLQTESGSIDLFDKIQRAMHCLELMNEYNIIGLNNFELANNWINAFWWAASSEDQRHAGKIVLEYFENAATRDQIPEKQILVITYLRGEINRRIGNQEEACKYFDQVIELADKLPDPNNIVSLAKKQKENPKENL